MARSSHPARLNIATTRAESAEPAQEPQRPALAAVREGAPASAWRGESGVGSQGPTRVRIGKCNRRQPHVRLRNVN
jgi:hypothetical protein